MDYCALEEKGKCIGYIVMEVVDNIENYINKKIQEGIEKEDVIHTVMIHISELAHKLIDLKYFFNDTNSGNFGFRGDQIVLLDLETLTPHNYVAPDPLKNLTRWLSNSIISYIEEKYSRLSID